MKKVMFVCHGNICRSPMAEFVLKYMVSVKGIADEFKIASSATSTEEIGNPVHIGTKRKLNEMFGISTDGKTAVQLRKADYSKYDYIIGMDSANIRNMLRIFGGDAENKVYRLLDFTPLKRDVADPWYTGDFDKTFNDVLLGCDGFLKYLGF